MRANYGSDVIQPVRKLPTARSAARWRDRTRPERQRQPDRTRRALIEAAANIFNSAGYHGTDSNRIAREAGYAPGTFYIHFPDKLAIFLQVYENWVSAEWSSIEVILKSGASARAIRRRLSRAVLEHHRKWRTFRASLRALSATDDR
ncbi:MAG: TetR/AcrR family transcriptional regulator, partial [Candidatus Binatus sp.]